MATHGIHAPGYRLPDSTRLGAIWLAVSDLERSLRYYQIVLGLRVLERHDTHAALCVEGSADGLVHLHAQPGIRAIAQHSRLGLYHFALLVPDRVSLGRFLTHVMTLGMRVGSSDHAVSEALYLWDPDGLGIEVYADRPRQSWRLQGQELFMTLDPLDLPGLMALGDDVPWTGMPAGTALGHMHLHVGDLQNGEAFYHRALGFDKTVWSYRGALFLSAGGYHHHLGTNTWAGSAPPASESDARLLEWEVVVPSLTDIGEAAHSLDSNGYAVLQDGNDCTADDPWGTRLRLVASGPLSGNNTD